MLYRSLSLLCVRCYSLGVHHRRTPEESDELVYEGLVASLIGRLRAKHLMMF